MEWHYVVGSWIKSHSEGILAEQITGNIRGCCNYVCVLKLDVYKYEEEY